MQGWNKTKEGGKKEHLIVFIVFFPTASVQNDCIQMKLELVTLQSKIINLAFICWAQQEPEAKQLIAIYIIALKTAFHIVLLLHKSRSSTEQLHQG